MKPDKKIVDLRGAEVKKSYPTQDEMDALPKKKVGSKEIPDLSCLEKETVGNVIINCLTAYPSREKKDGFYINAIAQSIIQYDGEDIDLKEKVKKFLIQVLEESMVRVEKEKDKEGNEKEFTKGLYFPWVIAQVLKELGEDIEE